MDSAKSKIILLFISAALTAMVISACNSNQPVIMPNKVGGTLPTFTPTPCNGVFGSVTVCSTLGTTYGGTVFFYPVTTTTARSLISLSAYSSSSGPITYEMGVYANTTSSPSTLLGQTGQITSGPVTGWNIASLSSAVSLASYTAYWLALHSTNLYFQSAVSVTYAYQNGVTTFGSLPSPSAATTAGGFIFSYYGTTCP